MDDNNKPIDFDKIILSKQELKLLRIMRYHRANKLELHGYLIFPGIEDVLIAIHNLETEYRLITEEIVGERYFTNDVGKKYIKYLSDKKRSNFFKGLGGVITVLAALASILQFVK